MAKPKKVDEFSENDVNNLSSQLHSEIERLTAEQASDLEQLTMRYREQMRQLQQMFVNELEDIQRKHQNRTDELKKHVLYLEEMSRSQRLMMKDQLDYVKQLELRIKGGDPENGQKK